MNIKKEQSFCDVDTDIRGSSCLPYHTATFFLFLKGNDSSGWRKTRRMVKEVEDNVSDIFRKEAK